MSVSVHKQSDKKESTRFNIKAIIVHFLLAGIVILFLTFAYSYIFSNNKEKWTDFRLPKIFWLSTVFILAVSFFLNKALKSYNNDRATALRRNILCATFFSIAFLVCQVIGWLQLNPIRMASASTTSSDYVYILSGVHAVHVLAGIIFLCVALVRCYIQTKDEVKALLYFTDPARKLRLRLVVHYWHTIDFLWVFLFLCFLYMHT